MKQLLAILLYFSGTSIFAQGQLQTETSAMIKDATDKLAQLAEAIPADKYSWSPEEGVRSIAGVCGHVISVNYFIAMKLGATLPEGVNPRAIEQELTTKEQLVPVLKSSSELVLNAIKSVKDESLGEKMDFPFPGEYTTMSAILISQSHSNEHLGQLIAYSRMNGITPPWSKQDTK